MSDGAPDESDSTAIQVRFAGDRVWPTLRWAAAVLRRSPILLVAAIVASSAELVVAEGDPIRWFASLLAALLVTAFVAIVAKDAVDGRKRSTVERARTAVSSLPLLALTLVIFLFLLLVGVILPIVFIRFFGVIIALIVAIYLVALIQIILPAVVLDGSITEGRAAFADSRVLVFGLLVVVAIARAPITLISPTPAEPRVAAILAVWAGRLNALSGLAYARVYIAHRSRSDDHGTAGSGHRPADRRGTTSGRRSNDGWDLG